MVDRIGHFVQVGTVDRVQLRQTYKSVEVREAALELDELENFLEAADIAGRTQFNLFLARGLSFYTGTVYEIFDAGGAISSSLGSGGRYDAIIGSLLESGGEFPAVGISFGLDAIMAALREREARGLPEDAGGSWIDVMIIPLGTESFCFRFAKRLRGYGVRVELDMTGKKLRRSLEYAGKERIPYVILIGDEELRQGTVRLRDMSASREYEYRLDDLQELVNQIKGESK